MFLYEKTEDLVRFLQIEQDFTKNAFFGSFDVEEAKANDFLFEGKIEVLKRENEAFLVSGIERWIEGKSDRTLKSDYQKMAYRIFWQLCYGYFHPARMLSEEERSLYADALVAELDPSSVVEEENGQLAARLLPTKEEHLAWLEEKLSHDENRRILADFYETGLFSFDRYILRLCRDVLEKYGISGLQAIEGSVNDFSIPLETASKYRVYEYARLGISREKQVRRGTYKTKGDILAPIDKATRLLMERGDKQIYADAYDGRDITVGTGSNISMVLNVVSEFDIDNDERLNDEDRFWLEAAYSIAEDGHDRMTGGDILKRNGYSNPYDAKGVKTMEQAARSIVKVMGIRAGIDTTNEEKAYAKRGRVVKSVAIKHLIEGEIELNQTEDGTVDFDLTLKPEDPSDAKTAFPLLQYALAKGQVLILESNLFDFKTVKDKEGNVVARGLSLNGEHRRMARYMMRRANEKGTNNTIVLETMFQNLGIEVDKYKKNKLMNVMERILVYWKITGVIKGYEWGKKGRSFVSVTIDK